MKFLHFAAFAALALFGAEAKAQQTFSFVAIGDMPYGERAVIYPKFTALIGAINATQPDFTLHIGDIKSGTSVCSDEEFTNQRDFMNAFRSALIYTPGDNDWTDCDRFADPATGKPFSELGQLDMLRKRFFARPPGLRQTDR